MDEINAYLEDSMLGIFCFGFLFIGMGARLLPTWMFINSLQLIAHTPLLAANMPSNLNYFLVQILGVARLNSKHLDEVIESQERQDGISNYKLTSDAESAFTYLLNDCGYKHTFSRNLVIILFIIFLLLLIIIILAAYDLLQKHRVKSKSGSTPLQKSNKLEEKAEMAKQVYEGGQKLPDKKASKRSLRSQHHSGTFRKTAWMANFTLRFIYMFFFEFFLCGLIHLSTANVSSGTLLVMTIVIFLALAALIFLLCSLFFARGPYITPTVYEKGSLLGSWWGVRPLCSDLTSGQDLEDVI